MKNAGWLRILFLGLIIAALSGNFTFALDDAPGFELADLGGVTLKLSDYQGKQPVMLLFWTTWCPFCRTELKDLNRRYSQLKNENIEILAINIGESENRVKAFIESRPVDYRILLDEDSSVADNYGLVGVPTYILIDKNGKIVSKGNGFPERKYKELMQQ